MQLPFLFPIILYLTTTVKTTDASALLQDIHLLQPRLGSSGSLVRGLSCLSWRLGVEAHNIIDWDTVPLACEGYVGHYMLGHQYRKDSKAVTCEALEYAKRLKLMGNGKDIWVFDVDETSLSNLPYYAIHGFGAEPYNSTRFREWVLEGKALALPETLKLYNKLVSIGFTIIFLTGRTTDLGNATASNLKNVGYRAWEKLIFRGSAYKDATAVAYKSSQRKMLEKEGYKIWGNIGDQWSDILGTHVGNRTFKLPDPMYYVQINKAP